MASVDPTTIHPEHDTLTPENWDEWTEEQREQYLEAKDAELEEEASENRTELAARELQTLDALRSTTDRDEELTETVSLGDAEVTVTTKLSGRVEQVFNRVNQARGDELVEALIDGITLLIVDDDEGGKYDFTSRAVWEAYYYDEGTEGLADVFEVVSDPALTRRENLGN